MIIVIEAGMSPSNTTIDYIKRFPLYSNRLHGMIVFCFLCSNLFTYNVQCDLVAETNLNDNIAQFVVVYLGMTEKCVSLSLSFQKCPSRVRSLLFLLARITWHSLFKREGGSLHTEQQ